MARKRVPLRNPNGSKFRPCPRPNARCRVRGLATHRTSQKENKRGRPALQFDEHDLLTARLLKSRGRTNDQIADVLGISRPSFYRHLKNNAAFRESIRRGELEIAIRIDTALIREAIKGSLGHIQYAHRVLRLHPHAWAQRIEHTGKDRGVIATDTTTRGVLSMEEIAARLQGLFDGNESTVASPSVSADAEQPTER